MSERRTGERVAIISAADTTNLPEFVNGLEGHDWRFYAGPTTADELSDVGVSVDTIGDYLTRSRFRESPMLEDATRVLASYLYSYKLVSRILPVDFVYVNLDPIKPETPDEAPETRSYHSKKMLLQAAIRAQRLVAHHPDQLPKIQQMLLEKRGVSLGVRGHYALEAHKALIQTVHQNQQRHHGLTGV